MSGILGQRWSEEKRKRYVKCSVNIPEKTHMEVMQIVEKKGLSLNKVLVEIISKHFKKK